jgi:hypothetical protein
VRSALRPSGRPTTPPSHYRTPSSIRFALASSNGIRRPGIVIAGRPYVGPSAA